MIRPICARCQHELREFGGILIGPPIESEFMVGEVCEKTHLCKECYNITNKFIYGS